MYPIDMNYLVFKQIQVVLEFQPYMIKPQLVLLRNSISLSILVLPSRL